MPVGTLNKLRALGFDRAEHVPFTREFRLGCSQCEALAINGVATHETGCPNARYHRECFECGCDFIGERYERICADCREEGL